VNDSERAARRALALRGPLVELRRSPKSVVYRADGVGIVRVAATPATIVRTARLLADAGAPVAPPLGDPIEIDGLVVSVWHDAPDQQPRDFAAMGRALARFHYVGSALVADGTLAVTPFAPRDWAARQLEHVTDSDLRDTLARRVDELARRVGHGDTLLHTDAHQANFRVADGRAVLIDLESVATGHALYDLAALEVTERRFRGEHAAFAAFAAFAGGYGHDPDDPALRVMIALRETLAVAFCCGIGRVDVARRRLRTLDTPGARWHPY
jgi:hypothetical protein